MRIFFLVPYPLHQAPSQRFRFEQYLQILKNHGHEYASQSFFSSKYRLGRNDSHFPRIIWALSAGFFRRFFILFRIWRYDFVFIHRESFPIGPPLFEWIIAKWIKKRIIYDFDDAIWLTDNDSESRWQRWIRHRSKVSRICRWSYRVSCGNQYLVDFAKAFNNDTIINPTTIDLSNYPQSQSTYTKDEELLIGWTGTHTTLKYLLTLETVFLTLFKIFPSLQLHIIAEADPRLQWGPVIFSPWRRESEAADLEKFSIGVMPLPDDPWTRGKCGAKALQYMAAGVPCIASPVGTNKTIIENGVDGFLCDKQSDWLKILELLLRNPDLRARVGEKGRAKVERCYSTASNASNFLRLFT